jgi:hypothetical protein
VVAVTVIVKMTMGGFGLVSASCSRVLFFQTPTLFHPFDDSVAARGWNSGRTVEYDIVCWHWDTGAWQKKEEEEEEEEEKEEEEECLSSPYWS